MVKMSDEDLTNAIRFEADKYIPFDVDEVQLDTQKLVDAGVLASIVEEVDYGPLLRARDTTGPGDAAGVRAATETVLASLAGLQPGRADR